MKKDSLIEILIGIVVIIISISGIIIVVSLTNKGAEKRAEQRAADLRNLQTIVENYKLANGMYPNTGFVREKLKTFYPSYSERSTYPEERWDECKRPKDWIPNLTISLPKDPANSCQNKANPYPRYEYISDGQDYKILSYRLEGEICGKEGYKELIDPVRLCSSYELSWAVYSPGAKNW